MQREQEKSGITDRTKICANIGVQLHKALFIEKSSIERRADLARALTESDLEGSSET